MRLLLAALAAFAAQAASIAPAAGLDGAPDGVSVGAAAITAHYESEERIGNFVFNRERGTLNGARLEVRGAMPGTPRWGIGLESLQGRLAYDGLSQFGFPVSTTTRLHLQRASLRVHDRLPPLVGAGSAAGEGPGDWFGELALVPMRTRRSIEASDTTLPLVETMRQTDLAGALSWRSGASGPHGSLGVSWPLRLRLEVDSLGVLDTHELRPGARAAVSTMLGWRQVLAGEAGLVLHAAARGEWRRYGASDPVAVTRAGQFAGISRYPGSRQAVWGLEFGIIGHWR